MRGRYLFLLGCVCGYTPRDVDEMGFIDFISVAAAAEEWFKADAQRPRL